MRNDLFLRACRLQPVERTPVWFMRQAGRYQAEYRALRERHSFLALCREPELAAQVTVFAVEQLGVDAAILFSDIVVPLLGIGLSIDIQEGVGPVIAQPVRTVDDLARLRPLEPDTDVPYVAHSIRLAKAQLKVPLIGFVGGPFTLASYLVEGGPSRTWARTKALMHGAPEVWHELMRRLADIVATHALAQLAAGADALQVFDSWVGALSLTDYEQYVLPHMQRVFRRLAASGQPVIHFAQGACHLLPRLAEAGGDVIGVDWRLPLGQAWQLVGPRGLQGNLDPALLLAPWEAVVPQVDAILRQAAKRPGHIFNLGHGVLPQTSPDTLKRIVARVQEGAVA